MTDNAKNPWATRWLPAVLLGAFAVLAVGYAVTIPPGEGVDETPHFDYVRYVKENRCLPVQPVDGTEAVKVWMGHHPPLYYVLGALAISWSDTSDFGQTFRPNPHFIWNENLDDNGWNVMLHFGQDQFPGKGSVLALYVVRFMTVGLGLVTVFAVFRASQFLFGQHSWLPLGATAIVAFNPSFIFMSSTVHHDGLQAAIFALASWWMLALLSDRERTRGYFAVGGLLAGAAMLTKLSGLALLPVMGLALALRAYRRRAWSEMLRPTLLTFGVAALIAGWWYVRNQWLYGDPLGWHMFLSIHSHMVRSTAYTWSTFTHEFVAQVGRTFWGGFGYMHITFPEIARILWCIVGLATAGLLVGIVTKRFPPRQRWAEWLVAVVLLLLLFASFVRFSIATVGAGHGRYLFPAALPVGALMIAGLSGLFAWRLQREVALVVFAGMLAYAVWLPARFVLPKYAPEPTIDATELPPQAVAVNLPVASGLELAAYSLAEERPAPGRYLHFTLYWQASGSAEARQDPKIRLALVDEQTRVLDSYESWPVPSLPPDVWSEAHLYLSQVVLRVPPDRLPTTTLLSITPMLRIEGHFVDQSPVQVAELPGAGGMSPAAPADIPNPRAEVFASEIRLMGWGLSSSDPQRGTILGIDLYWQAIRKPADNYTVFIHLYDGANNLVTQYDRLAGGETLPTSAWQPEELWRDTYPLAIPATLPAGTYYIRMGMYTWPSMHRLPITSGGEPVGDILQLVEVRVQP
jgi:4-amino-4-deoxy-L-arabinose transferase-like glycosyltransferase